MKNVHFTRNPEILIVDDNPEDIQFFIDLLVEKSYHVNVLTCGVDALSYLLTEVPDLIVLDVVMPDMTGIEVCKAIRKQESLEDVPVIFATAENDTMSVINGFEAGGQDYVLKPLNAHEFLARIDTQLRLKFHAESRLEENFARLKVLYEIYNQTTREFNIDALIYETMFILRENLAVDIVGFYFIDEKTGEQKLYSNLGLSMSEKEMAYEEKFCCYSHEIIANELKIGSIRVCSRTDSPIAESDRELLGAVCSQVGNIIQNARLYASLRNSEAKYKGLVENSDDIIFSINTSLKITTFNRAFVRLVGLNEKEIEGKAISDIFTNEQDRKIWKIKLAELMERKTGTYFDFRLESGKIRENHFHVALIPVLDLKGEIGSILCSGHNVSDLIRKSETINYLAYFDPMTDLPNRNRFFELAKSAISDLSISEGSLAILILNVDGFKRINDVMGHSAGDQIIKEVAKRLREVISKEDVLARLCGDEFAILVKSKPAKNDIDDLCASIYDRVRVPVLLDGIAQTISCSIGGVLYPEHGKEYEELLKNADLALNYTKKEGHGHYRMYTSEMRKDVEFHISMEKALDLALEKNEMHVVFQPQINLDSHRIRGVEALLRWNNAQFGNVEPMKFVPILEESDRIIHIGSWVMKKAFEMAGKLKKAGYPTLIVAVNVSAAQILDDNFVTMIEENRIATGVHPDCIELEITESLFMGNANDSIEKLELLRGKGYRIALDDFGTGYSSLTYLNKLPINLLKIDQSFAKNISTDEKDRAIIGAFIELAHKLDIEVVAEGVEQEDQKRKLKQCKCDYLQGNLFSKPLEEYALSALLNNIKPMNPKRRD